MAIIPSGPIGQPAPALPTTPGAPAGPAPVAPRDTLGTGTATPSWLLQGNADFITWMNAQRTAQITQTQGDIDNWSKQDPWNTIDPNLPKGTDPLALPAPLNSAQRDLLKKLLKAGVDKTYAEKMVRRGDKSWARIMLLHSFKKGH